MSSYFRHGAHGMESLHPASHLGVWLQRRRHHQHLHLHAAGPCRRPQDRLLLPRHYPEQEVRRRPRAERQPRGRVRGPPPSSGRLLLLRRHGGPPVGPPPRLRVPPPRLRAAHAAAPPRLPQLPLLRDRGTAQGGDARAHRQPRDAPPHVRGRLPLHRRRRRAARGGGARHALLPLLQHVGRGQPAARRRGAGLPDRPARLRRLRPRQAGEALLPARHARRVRRGAPAAR
mmetsp:Transcript_27313/g.72050  ORF Transcript_27313/g.72050 Transcript_27313/m.72050 type:complete len:230 (-) Transcript_27313:225-914(-)